ncbi:YdiK family protein [Anoxybacteroides tepidamans]|uniref:YdiK family protein n=1 Tax=Anoxybacteroides tepidamans TaxID=265948 RepID=UPI0004841D46|nr:YdiK family protein [Anoxybacillus tepidamans]
MRTSPLNTALFYFLMGSLFTYLAIESAHETIWNFSTVALMVMATLDFGVFLRLLTLYMRIKNQQK